MTSIKEGSNLLLKAVEEQDKEKFKRCRVAMVAALANNDYMINSTENIFEMSSVDDNLLVGKALTILLYDMSKSGPIYRRVVTAALYCLVKSIINDKEDLNKETAEASIFLLILFQENLDFIGGEYVVRMVGNNADAATHQFISMTCVFYWMYKFSSFHIDLDRKTNDRLQKAISELLIQIPDESTRMKVIDFEYNNFSTMLRSLPLDFELKYPGVPFFDPDIVIPKIDAMFGASIKCFGTITNGSPTTLNSGNEPAHNKSYSNKTQLTNPSSKGAGCLPIIVLIIVISIFGII